MRELNDKQSRKLVRIAEAAERNGWPEPKVAGWSETMHGPAVAMPVGLRAVPPTGSMRKLPGVRTA